MTPDQSIQMVEDVAAIKRAVIGESRWGRRGLIERMEAVEDWQKKMNIKSAFYSGAATTIVLLVKAGFDFIVNHH